METRKQSLKLGPSNVDRLSSLPDSILSHILSFLPTHCSAATSILARRWRFLWADVPNIHLDFGSHRNWIEERPHISDVINRIILGHNLKALNTFCLNHTNSNAKDILTHHQLETWIAAVIARGQVQNIELEFNYCMKLPECLFTCKSLVELRLSNCEMSISLPASISFPILTKLHLYYVKYNNDENFRHLISGCKLLEELTVFNKHVDIPCVRIYSPTLKWLTVQFRSFKRHTVEIITPTLQYLRVLIFVSKPISAKALSSLTEADIQLVMLNIVSYRYAVEFLDGMRNVEFLRWRTHKFPHSVFFRSSQRFHKLIKLELATEVDWLFILKFLETADNLQVLIIKRVVQDLIYRWVEPQHVATCLLSHVKSIVISSFCCEECEYTMVRYLLKNAKVLTSMKIRCRDHDDKKKFDALKRISLFERGSETCKLDFN